MRLTLKQFSMQISYAMDVFRKQVFNEMQIKQIINLNSIIIVLFLFSFWGGNESSHYILLCVLCYCVLKRLLTVFQWKIQFNLNLCCENSYFSYAVYLVLPLHYKIPQRQFAMDTWTVYAIFYDTNISSKYQVVYCIQNHVNKIKFDFWFGACVTCSNCLLNDLSTFSMHTFA